MVFSDDEIEKSRVQEQSGSNAAKRGAAERKRTLEKLSKSALRAKKQNDARAFREQLKLADVVENSPEWDLAWKYFYHGCG